jgi:hypothetical protein
VNALEELNRYLRQLETRLRVLAVSRGVALLAMAALVATVLLAISTNAVAFSNPVVMAARVTLFLLLAALAALAVFMPLIRLNRTEAARKAEAVHQELEQRLLTVAEARDAQDPFVHLLAADTLEALRGAGPEQVASNRRLFGFLAAAGAAAGVLVWLVLAGPGFLGYGAALLWAGPPKGPAARFYDIVVTPGDVTVWRKADQLITARLVGFEEMRVRLRARYRGATKWEEVEMRPEPESTGFQFLMAGIPETLDYYVVAGLVRSPTHTISVKDLPTVKRIRVTYHYPEWLGQPDRVEDPGGDVRAVEGTEAEVAVETDRPLANGGLVLDNGTRVALRGGKATIAVKQDGSYYIAAFEKGQPVRLSEDYFIEAQQDGDPMVRLERPGRDARATPIEEVAVQASAADDFGLGGFDLHYSVNGGPEKTVPLLKNQGAKEATGTAMLYLEDFKLVPGDVVSLYATARDARTQVKTDMYFIQAEPFERAYSQSQQMGGAQGGDGDEQNQISERQKEIIAATWNQLRDRAPRPEDARFLSDVQGKLRDQAQSLAHRMESRQLSGTNEQFKSFSREMQAAAREMNEASGKLKRSQWQAALTPEQKALQHLLRAESTFREIQVAFGNRGGGGGGGRNSSARDLENLFDLELDTEKNQYETGRQSAASQRDRDQEQAFNRLEQLARRQQELAQQAQRQQHTPQQRWQQEVLRREAEELARQLRAQNQGGQSSQSQSQQRAAEQLQRAIEDMRRAQSQGGAEAQRAAERLRDALTALRGSAQEEARQKLDDLQRRSESLSDRQRDYVNKLQRMYDPERKQQASDLAEAQRLADEREKSIEDLQKLEKDLQEAVRNLAGTERSVSSKLRESLGNLQQDEISTRMRYNTDLVRRGLGTYTVMREAPVTRGLDDLREGIRDAQQSLSADPRMSQQPQRADLARALEQVEQLRRDLQRAEQAQQGQRGGPQRQQQGRPGEQGFGGPAGPYIRGNLARLRRALQDYPELGRRIEGASAGDLRVRLEQIELELRRKLETGDGQVRIGPGDTPPPGYADAVAEYFRRLSKTGK